MKFLWRLMMLLLAGTSCVLANDAPSAARPALFGLVKVEPEEAGFDRRLTVHVEDLDGWLIDQVRRHRMVGPKYFSATTYRVWQQMLPLPEKVPDWGTWLGDIWRSAAKDKAALNETKSTTKPEYVAAIAKQEEQFAALRAYTALRTEVRNNIYLILGNSRLKHVRPYYISAHGELEDGRTVDRLDFIIRNDQADKEEWGKLIRGAQRRLRIQVRLGVDFGGTQYTINPVLGEAKESTAGFFFVTYGSISLVAGIVLVVAALAVFVWLAVVTDLLRDPDTPRRPGGRRQFSLARSQTAFWLFLMVSGYVFLWVVKGETDTLSDQCLVLLGISAGTMLGANFITKGHRLDAMETHRKYDNPFQRFFYELLSDGERLTFYRFQMVVWTAVLGMVFVRNVWSFLEMPVYGTNELALMGISAASYLSFKFPEARSQARLGKHPA